MSIATFPYDHLQLRTMTTTKCKYYPYIYNHRKIYIHNIHEPHKEKYRYNHDKNMQISSHNYDTINQSNNCLPDNFSTPKQQLEALN